MLVSGSDKTKLNLITRLKKVEGQVRGVSNMIDREVYCDEVLNQISAIHAALNSVESLILERHLKSCIIERIQAGENDEVINDLLVTVRKMMK